MLFGSEHGVKAFATSISESSSTITTTESVVLQPNSVSASTV
jgi:hypothetical protein